MFSLPEALNICPQLSYSEMHWIYFSSPVVSCVVWGQRSTLLSFLYLDQTLVALSNERLSYDKLHWFSTVVYSLLWSLPKYLYR